MIPLQAREGLLPLIKAIREKGTPPDTSVLHGTFDTDAQAELCNAIARELGFDLERGRLDVSVHPFTGGEYHSRTTGCISIIKMACTASQFVGRLWLEHADFRL
jgi:hypothetical protein